MGDVRIRDVIGGAVAIIVGAVFAVDALNYPIGTLGRPEAGLVPLGMGVILALLGAAEISQLLILAKNQRDQAAPVQRTAVAAIQSTEPLVADDVAADEDPDALEAEEDVSNEPWRAALTLVGLAVFALLLQQVGFLISAFAMMAIVLRAMGYRTWVAQLVVAAGTSTITYVLFREVFGVLLPRGPIF